MKEKQELTVFSFSTISNGGLSNVLWNEVFVEESIAEDDPIPAPSNPNFKGIWDTGATNSAISQRVINAKGLSPIGQKTVCGVHGAQEVDTFLVSLYLPNGICIKELEATKADLGTFDVLIGMDVMNQGDFVVTNRHGKTCFSFRSPSLQRIDFARWKPRQDHGCLCGSGKSFKKCCLLPNPSDKS